MSGKTPRIRDCKLPWVTTRDKGAKRPPRKEACSLSINITDELCD